MRAASGHSLVTGSVHYGPALPASGDKEHVCGVCRNPTGITNPNCPNRTKETR